MGVVPHHSQCLGGGAICRIAYAGTARLGCPSSEARSLVLVARAKSHHRCLGISAAYQALSLRFENHRFLAYQALRFLSHQRMLPFVSSQRFGFVIKPSLCFEIIAPLWKPSLHFVSGIACDAASSLGLKSPLGPSPVLFPLPRVTSNLALASQISNDDRGQDGPLPSKPAGLKPFVSKSLIPKSFDRGRLRRTFRYNDDSKDVEKRGEGGYPAIHTSNRPHPPRASRRFPYLFWPEINSPHLPESSSPEANNFPQEIRVPDGWDGVRCSRSSFIPA